MKIAIIGSGNLGLSIAKGLIISDSITKLYLTKRNVKSIKSWEGYKNVIITSDNQEAVKKSDILIFSLQPTQMDKILSEVKMLLSEHHVIIVTAAGYKISNIESIIGSEHFIIRAMPNTAISIGQSMTCISSNDKGKKRVKLAKAIFNKLGNSVEISEDLMQAATVICASGIAFWMRLLRSSSQGATQLGFDADLALKLSVYTCLGAASLLASNENNHPEQEIDKVTTPRGCTIEGLNEFEHQGLSSSFIKGIVASYEKISSITKK